VPKLENALVVRLPTNVCWCEGPWFAREDDRFVGRLVREAAVLDEVDADEIRTDEPRPLVAGLRLLAGQRRRPESRCGNEQ
jgi:hypothetical protein